uniref:Xylulose kinase-1 n=1 Tax=Tanacetum cinerariifolium TaxID=118510 RepID=A0A6L2LUD2_TANCI|nr:hypothetical protein [Tanacetum cinerariifolium]
MITYLTKSDPSEGFNQIINFLNGSSIKYALTVNPNIYVACIKQFWTSVAVKKVNDVMRLQALVDKKKVIITEASIRDVLCLDDAEGIECLPNEEIFAELARMGYEKPFTKLTFYKAFFSSQWKFFIHTILQCMSAKQTSWNEFSSSMASAVICLSTGDLSSHTTKYASPTLSQKIFTNMRRVGKGFYRMETPLFEGMIVAQEVADKGDAEVNVDDVPAVGVAAEGDVSVANDDVPTTVEEPSIPSPTPHNLPPQPFQDIPSTSQVPPTPPQSPQVQPQPSHDAGLPMDLLQNLMDTCTTITRKVKHLEQDKVAQALEITKLKQRVKKLKRRNKAYKLKRFKKVGIAQRIDTSDDTVMDDDVAVEKSVHVDESAQVQGRQAESQAQIYQIDLEHANKVLSMQDDDVEPAKLQEVVEVVTPTKLITERKEVVIRDPQETATPSIIIHSEAKSKDKGKGILVEEPKPLKKQAQIKQDEAYRESKKEDNVVKRYQVLKMKPQTEAQARKSMMIYLRNVAGFKIDYFKGMTYDDIRPIFEKHFNSNVYFLQKIKEQMDEEDSRALKRVNESQEDNAAKKQKLDDEVSIVDYEIYNEHNKPYYKIKKADDSHQLYLSFLSMLRNFDKEDLEVLWEMVKERFATTKPKNFSDDFLLTTLRAMFKKPDIQAQIWKNQRSVHGLAKVKSWKLLESCGVQIISFTTTQLILLVERIYPLSRFTLGQLVNNVRLKVEEESKVSLELMSFGVDAAEELKKNMLNDYCCQAKMMLLINAAKLN